MKRHSLSMLLCIAIAQIINAQLQNGPMLGYNEMKEVLVWVQTAKPATVSCRFWNKETPNEILQSNDVRTQKTDAFTAHLICAPLEPGTTYSYEIVLDGIPLKALRKQEFTSQSLWQFRTDPPDFRLATGSCNFINDIPYDRPGEGYGGDYQIFSHIHEQNPDLMLWLGDNIYLREPDWTTTTGINYRYTHTRGVSELQPLLGSCHHYAIWDDHDYGPDNSDRSFINKRLTQKGFQNFWGNPSYGLEPGAGITTQFSYNDVDVFLMDNRWFRSDNNIKGSKETILGKAQKKWLIDALKYSRSQIKIVCIGGQFLSDAAVHENYAQYEEERNEILDLISRNDIKGVLFLTGDKHSTELSSLTLENGNKIYDLTVSPFTSTSYDNWSEPNSNRVVGTYVGERNFGILDFSGSYFKRTITISIFNSEGELMWDKSIKPEDW